MVDVSTNSAMLIDALPYYDQGYDEPGAREQALALIQEEMMLYKPTADYLQHFPLPEDRFETHILRNEMERMAVSQPMETISMKRYELPEPPTGLRTDVDAWRNSVDNSQAQLEQQSLRIMNLDLLLGYGSSAWKVHNEQLECIVTSEEKQLRQLKQRIQEVNWERKKQQTEGGEGLSKLSAEWNYLIKENLQIEEVCLPLEREVEHFKTLLEQK